MDIIAKAKPVRFRIVSGGVECTSLDDLRTHFDIKSIADTIMDGRLAKWLDGIGKPAIASKIRSIKEVNTESFVDTLNVISTLSETNYQREKGISNLEYIKHLDSNDWTTYCAELIIKEKMLKDQEVLLYAYHHHRELVKNPTSFFGTFLDNGNPEVLWIYGSHVYSENKKKARVYIEQAAEKGLKVAQDFLLNHKLYSKDEVCRKIKETLNNGLNFEKSLQEFKLLSEDTISYDEETREVFKLCSHYTKGLCGRCSLSINKFTQANFAFVKEVSRFLYLYAHESKYSLFEIGNRYDQINFKPAEMRAKQFRNDLRYYDMFIKTKFGVRIKMPENPSGAEYRDFIIEFLSNIYNF